MSRRPARFTQSDVARALKGAEQAGVKMAVEISPDGTIRLVPEPEWIARQVARIGNRVF